MENAVCNFGAVGLLLNKAGHPSTFDTEALTFLRHAYKLCDKAGLSLSDTIAIEKDSRHYAALSKLPKKAYLDNIADLEVLVAQRDAEIIRLRKGSVEKDAKISSLEAIPSDKVKVAELEETCVSQAGLIDELKGHLAAIQERLRETEAQRDRTQRGMKVDVVHEKADVQPLIDADLEDPIKVGDFNEKIDAGVPRDAKSGSPPAASVTPQLFWTDIAKAKLVEYASKGFSTVTIGRRLAREFGGRVTSSIVAAMLRTLLIADAEGFLWASHWR